MHKKATKINAKQESKRMLDYINEKLQHTDCHLGKSKDTKCYHSKVSKSQIKLFFFLASKQSHK